MAYNPNIPQPTDIPANSQADLLANFQALQTYLNLNHDNIVGGTGKHKQVNLPVLAADPATAAGEMALYTKNVAGVPHLFLRPQGSGTVIDMVPEKAGTSTLGYCILPGGLKMIWGQDTTAGTPSQKIVSFAAGVIAGWPGFTAAPTIQLTAIFNGVNNASTAYIQASAAGSVTVRTFWTDSSGSNWMAMPFNYLAIGV